jgi:hypothetical protein
MKATRRAAYLVTLLTLSLAACQSLVLEPPEGTAYPGTRSATASPTTSPTATVTVMPSVTPSPTEVEQALPPPTPDLIRLLPAGWVHHGNERLGIQMAAPRTWVDLTARLRSEEAHQRFGTAMLLLVDSEDTGLRLLDGAPLTQGAFAFAYVIGDSTLTDPQAALDLLLRDLDAQDSIVEPGRALDVAGLKGFSADVRDDVLGVFPATNRPLPSRLLVLTNPSAQRRYVLQVGTTSASWNTYQRVFATVLETVRFPDARVTVRDHLDSGDEVEGKLGREVKDLWTFNASEGHYATISLSPHDAIDPTLTLIAPSGRVVATADRGLVGDAELMADILLTETGTYLIEAGEFFGEAGGYTLSLTVSDAPETGGGGTIQLGAQLAAELADNREHVWLFQGDAGQVISIVLTSLEDQLDVILALQGPDGRVLAERDEGFAGDAEVLVGFELPVSGEYAILVRGFGGHGGAYSLSLDEGGEQTENFYDAGDLAHGESRRELLREDEAHAWFIRGAAGDEITLEVNPMDPALDMDVWLVDPSALEQLVRKDEALSGEPETINFILPISGQYIVLVREFFGEPGEYEISLDVVQRRRLEIVGRLSYGDQVSGTLEPGQDAGWTFVGLRNEAISIVLTPLDADADLVLVLLNPSGGTAVTIDSALAGAGESLINYPLPSTGQWTLVVREFFNEGASYDLSLTQEVGFVPTPLP